jgi:2,3-bisphosphoglycerate-dependent phosphoglycerate mutase
MYKLLMMRHGESKWNKENKFTGWTDVDLSEKGKIEALNASEKIKKHKIKFKTVFTSGLIRAQNTLKIILENLNYQNVKIKKSKSLNERHYGRLQGLNKDKTIKKYGEEKVHLWRRSYSTRPPLETHPKKGQPRGESLKDTYKRTIPYWKKTIIPSLKKEKTTLVVAHGNSIRAILKNILNISDEKIQFLEIPTGKIIVCEFDENFKLKKNNYLT